MPRKRTVNLQFPAGGIDLGLAYQHQQPYLTPLAQNVRPRESREGRQRGGSRPFLDKYSDTQLHPIEALKQGRYWQLGSGVDDTVFSMTQIGMDLYVGGSFTTAGGVSANRIAKYDTLTGTWSALGVGTSGSVIALAAIGTDLYVGGSFSLAGGLAAVGIAKYNTLTSTWSALGTVGTVFALAAIDNDLYVGGSFTTAGGVSANRIAKYDTLTGTWSPLTTGLSDNNARALIAIGTDLYVGGWFSSAGGVANTANIAKWDTELESWSALGTGTDSAVKSFTYIDTDLYVSGYFTTAGGVTVNCIAKWDTAAPGWSALGGATKGTDGPVYSIVAIDTDVFVGGEFSAAGGGAAVCIAKWDTTTSTWSALGTGTNDPVHVLAKIGADLFLGGSFTNFNGLKNNYIAGYGPVKTPVRMIATCNTAATVSAKQWSWDWGDCYGDWKHNGSAYFVLQDSAHKVVNSSDASVVGMAGHSLPDNLDATHAFSVSVEVGSHIYPMGGVTLLGYGREDFSYWGSSGHTYAYMQASRNGAASTGLTITCYKIEAGVETNLCSNTYSVANDGSIPIVLKMTIDGMAVSYYYNDILLYTEGIAGSFSGTQIGLLLQGVKSKSWQTSPSYAGCGTVTVNYSTVSYIASATKSVFSAGGNVYVQDGENATPTEVTPLVAGYHSLSPLHPTGAAEMAGKLYIADYSTPRQVASDGEFDSAGVPGLDKFVDGAATDWTAVGTAVDDTAIIPGSDLLVVTGDTGSPSNNGIYLITAVAAGSLTVTPSAAAKRASLNYSIMRSPKILDLSNNTLSVWKTATPETDGWVPAGCPLIARFAGRIYLAGEVNNPHVWYACAMGAPLMWDYSGLLDTDAIAGTIAENAVIASPLTALCPINEDIMLMTAVDEIWQMPGNIRVAGGIVNLSKEAGCIGANSWITTPEGRFIFLARGGIYVVDPTAGQFQSYAAQPFSDRPLPKELKGIIGSDFWISMAYDWTDQSIHLYVTPRGGLPGTHWVVDWSTRGFVKYTFNGAYQPCVVGQSCAGTLLLGGMDGYLRKYNPDAGSDDGVDVTSEVMIGPFPLAPPGYEGVMHDIRGVLGELSGDVTWELYVGKSAEDAYRSAAVETGTFSAGRGYSARPRRKGASAIVKLTSTGRWEMESIEVDLMAAGRQRLL